VTKSNTERDELKLEVVQAEEMTPEDFRELVELLATIIVDKLQDKSTPHGVRD